MLAVARAAWAPRGRLTSLARFSLPLAIVMLLGCDLDYPQVVVVNRTAPEIQLRSPSFNGCAWDTVLAAGEASSPGRCLPGEDRVHFEKLDAAAYCRDQAGGLRGDDGGGPTWFPYQTVTVYRVSYGEFHVFEITEGDMEQDFSVPGPYGH